MKQTALLVTKGGAAEEHAVEIESLISPAPVT
jgi:hypothetical protein